MQTSQRWVRRALGSGAVGALAVTTACLSVTWPTTVESGPYGAPGGGGSAAADGGTVEEDSSVPDTDGEATGGFTCNQISSLMCATYTGTIPSDTEASVMSACNLAGGLSSTSDQCPTASVIGCCSIASGGYSQQTCYYNGTTSSLSNSTGCTNASGTFSTIPAAL